MSGISIRETFAAFVCLVTACTNVEAKPKLVVTIYPLRAILQELAGDLAEVSVLLAPGASPHTYEPRPSDIRKAQSAVALFSVSPLLDGWAKTLPSHRRLEVSGWILTLGEDPHFWTDPILVEKVIAPWVSVLCEILPQSCSSLRERGDRFRGELERLNSEIASMLKPAAGRSVILFHPSFLHFLNRYGLKLAGVIEPSPGKEPTPQQLRGLIRFARKSGVRAIFLEPQLPKRPGELLAEETGARLLTLDPLGGVPGRMTYREIMIENAKVFLKGVE